MNEYLIFVVTGLAVAGGIFIATRRSKKKSSPSIISPKPEPDKPTYKLNWPDRRPIGMVMISSAPITEKEVVLGDRNWKLAGKKQFSKEALQEHANEVIKNCKSVNAQGVIIWGLEGEEFFHPVSYLGAPDELARLAPEMDSLADFFIGLFKQAELKVGLCIRPGEINWYGPPKNHYWHTIVNPELELKRKIKYSVDRWGCELFYVDSNVYENQTLIPAYVFENIAKDFPDILLIPEWEGEVKEYWEVTAPFKWLHQYRVNVSPTVKQKVSSAFMVLSVGDAEGDLKKTIAENNILMFRAWYPSPELEKIRQLYVS